MSKIVAKSKYSEWLGLVRIREIVCLEMQCIYRETSQDDFGIDGTIEMTVPASDGQRLTKGGIVNFQSKAGKKYVVADSADGFSTPVRMQDIEYWMTSNVPVIFIVYHPTDKCLYYVDIKDYVKRNRHIYTAPHKVEFDKARDVFDKNAYRELCQLAETTPPPIDFSQSERLFSNLFPVNWHTRVFTSAATRYISREEIFYDFNMKTESEEKFRLPPFFLFEDRIYTLTDLRSPDNLLRDFCDAATIADHDVLSWLAVDDADEMDTNFGGRDEYEDLNFVREQENTEIYARRDRQRKSHALRSNVINLFNQLLGRHLAERGLEYSFDFKRSFFPRENQKDLEFKRRWKSIRTGASDARAVCRFYDQYGSLRFWRHEALSAGFRVFGNRIYLEIEPKLFYTEDGITPCADDLVGPYSTGYKARRFNPAVLNDVLFWADVLGASKNREIEMRVGREVLIKISSEPVTFTADFSIAQPDSGKRKAKRDSSRTPRLFDETDDSSRSDDRTETVLSNKGKSSTVQSRKTAARGKKPQNKNAARTSGATGTKNGRGVKAQNGSKKQTIKKLNRN